MSFLTGNTQSTKGTTMTSGSNDRTTAGQLVVSDDSDRRPAEIDDERETAAPTDGHDAENCDDADAGDQALDSTTQAKRQRRVSISIGARSLLMGLLIIALATATATMTWLYLDAKGDLRAQQVQADNNGHAERVALDYAVNAAAMNFQDLNGWKAKLVAGTSPELSNKLTKAAESMQQILVPLQWTSTAQPLAAKVRSDTAGVYVVDCFVSVATKTVQAPDPLQSTATYSLTIDSTKGWQITDVGGVGAALGQR